MLPVGCAAGTYRDSSMSICTKCDTNTISAPGASVCTDCDPGSVSDEDRTECGKFRLKLRVNLNYKFICFITPPPKYLLTLILENI